MYMNRFLIGGIIGSIVGAIAMWYAISSDKEKKLVSKYVKTCCKMS